MNEKLARWRPFASHRLRLEMFEERWTLGGGGFLDAPLGLMGVAVIWSGPGESSELSSGVGTTRDASAVDRLASDSPSKSLLEPAFLASDWASPETDRFEGPSLGASDELIADLFDPGSVVLPDDLDLLNEVSDELSMSASAGFPSDATTMEGGAGNHSSVQSNFSATNSVPNFSQDSGNYATSNDSLNEVIARSSSSIATGGFAEGTSYRFGGNGGFRRVPVTSAMIAEGLADPNALRITSQNRNATTMMGGWNPALRSIMVMDDGSRWFAAEQGSDVNVNSSMIYYRLGHDGWKAAGSVLLPPGIQQNMATVTDGRTIYSYGITANSVVETWFHTDKPGWNLNTGNNLSAGGSTIRPGSNSNYVGAVWHDNTRIVWWTSVGINGSAGNWSYAFNRAGGWKGPIVSGLGGFNDVGYVRAQLDDQSRLHMIGESYRGHYPFGEKYLFSTTLTLGKTASWAPMLPGTAYTPVDIWQGTSKDETQFLYRTRTDQIGYSFGSGSASKSDEFAALDGRFITSNDRLGLVLSYGNFLEVRQVERSEATGFIDWNSIEPTRIGFPKSLGSEGLSAIWNVDHSKQPNESSQLEFAICGAYPGNDHLVYYYTV